MKGLFLLLILGIAFSATVVAEEVKTTPTTVKEEDKDSFSDRVTKHNDMYVVLGTPDTKIQISFKYKLMGALDLYLGYTQTMFWELGKQSMPFSDIDFNPELFYRLQFPKNTFVKAIDLGLLEHKSNGKAGDDSRAWSGSYVKLYTIVRFYTWSFNWDTKLKWFYNSSIDDPNRDIREYMGWWDTRFSLINYFNPDKFIDRIVMYFSLFSGGTYSQCIAKGGQEIGLGFRLGSGKVNPMLFMQFYNGYNESLLKYNQKYTAYRIGLAF